MTDIDLIISQAKQLAEQSSTIEYYRDRCEKLEAALRVRENITESGDDLPLDAVGTFNRMKVGAISK